jgi:hypothetical protein
MRNLGLWVAAACGVAFALLTAPSAAHAEGAKRTSSLAWVRLEGAESCIAAPALAQSVEARLGRKVFVSASDADITVEGTIGRAPKAGFRAQLRVTAKDGTILGSRDVETRAASCDAIDEKLSLIVSVLIDPDASMAPEETPPPAPAPPQAVIERERIVVVHDEPHAPPPPWRFELSVGVMGTVGLQPDIGLAFAPSVLLTPPRFWGIRAGGGIAATTSTDAKGGASADASLAHGTLALCPLATRGGRVEALACAGALVGALRARGIGFDTTTTTSSLVAGPFAMGRASLKIVGPLVTSLGLNLVVPIAHAEIGYLTASGENALFRTSAIGAMAELGIGVQLP